MASIVLIHALANVGARLHVGSHALHNAPLLLGTQLGATARRGALLKGPRVAIQKQGLHGALRLQHLAAFLLGVAGRQGGV